MNVIAIDDDGSALSGHRYVNATFCLLRIRELVECEGSAPLLAVRRRVISRTGVEFHRSSCMNKARGVSFLESLPSLFSPLPASQFSAVWKILAPFLS